MKNIIENNFTDSCNIHFEKSIAINGKSFLVIFGHHINGGFICLPGIGIGCEASDQPWETDYNANKLINAGLDSLIANILAQHIDEWICSERKEVAFNHVM